MQKKLHNGWDGYWDMTGSHQWRTCRRVQSCVGCVRCGPLRIIRLCLGAAPTDAGADWPLYWTTLVALGPEVTAFLRDDRSGAFLRGRGAYVREIQVGSNAFFGFGFGGTVGYAWALPKRLALSTGLDVAATWLHAEEAGDFGDYRYRYRIVSVAGVGS